MGLPALNELYTVGQWVSAIVVSSGSTDSKAKIGGRTGDENVRAAQRIELSTEPEKVNEGIAKGDLRAGFVRSSLPVTCCVLTPHADAHCCCSIGRGPRLHPLSRSSFPHLFRLVQGSEETATDSSANWSSHQLSSQGRVGERTNLQRYRRSS